MLETPKMQTELGRYQRSEVIFEIELGIHTFRVELNLIEKKLSQGIENLLLRFEGNPKLQVRAREDAQPKWRILRVLHCSKRK